MTTTRVEVDFADGRYAFWLPMEQTFAVERGPASGSREGEYPNPFFAFTTN